MVIRYFYAVKLTYDFEHLVCKVIARISDYFIEEIIRHLAYSDTGEVEDGGLQHFKDSNNIVLSLIELFN